MRRVRLVHVGWVFHLLVAVALGESSETPPRSTSTDHSSLMAVETLDGRTLVGHLEPTPDAATVHLRTERSGIVLRSQIPRDRVRQIRPYDDSHVLRIEGQASQRPFIPPQPSQRLVLSDVASEAEPVDVLRVRAWVENWDRDAEPDGLRVAVLALSKTGRPVSVNGSLTAELVARRFDYNRERDRLGVVERWSRQLKVNDFGPQGAIVDLPFNRIEPNRDFDLIPVGLLSVSLGVPGEGLFEAAEYDVPLRRPSYIRDELQLHTGSRQYRRLPSLPSRLLDHP
ncbi:hypothetical protein [Thalassoroseus pseudoceratinae]|uniref:hypothetical protein n=1 Tax=Thalassoroseus pseudoceratinae TaxID=2713176 RepID=UPI00141F92C1|nr:hypothetical protein [Thalassoroseus pseudoceratinae]